MNTVTDLTKGIYRRIYSGFVAGKRINSITMECEAWFWRLVVGADDFGNLTGDVELLRATLAPRRPSLSGTAIAKWNAALVGAGLISTYEAEGDYYLHILDWDKMQPAPRNGRRIQRVPLPVGESGGIRGNPGESCASHSDSDSHSDSHSHSHSEIQTAPTRRKAAVDAGDSGKWGKKGIRLDTKTWAWLGITEDDRRVWATAYPAVDIDRQLAAMAAWCKENPEKGRKANYGRFINGWLSREQDKGGDRGQGIQRGNYAGNAQADRGTPPGAGHSGQHPARRAILPAGLAELVANRGGPGDGSREAAGVA